MEEIMDENKILALTLAAVSDKTPTDKDSTPILSQILGTQNKKKTKEEEETQNIRKIEDQEISILPIFLHIVTCYPPIIKTDHINTFIDYVKSKCNYIESMGLDGSCIFRNIIRKMQIFLEFTKQHDDFVHHNLDWFQQRLFDIYVTSNPYNYKTIPAPKITTKFRPVQPIAIREVKVNILDEDTSNNTISNIIAIQGGIIMYSRHCMAIYCMTRDGGRNNVYCPSIVTDFTRIAHDTVLATIPFRKMILLINPRTFKIQRLALGFYKVSYLENFLFVAVELFGKEIYLVDWLHNIIKKQFIVKEMASDIAVAAGNKLLISFSNSKKVTSYNLYGLKLFEVETHSLYLATQITLYQNHFYVIQGRFIYKISTTGGVAKRDIGMKCRYISVSTDTTLVTNDYGVPHTIATNKDFWPKLSYNHQQHHPSLTDHIYIEDCHHITNILLMSTSILITYRNKKTVLFTNTGEIISQNNLNFPELPSVFCRVNSNRFLVFYPEIKILQYITYPELRKGPLIKVYKNYIKICHIISNKYLTLTNSVNKNEVHTVLIKENKVDILERISLKHYNITIATTPINFVVVDGRKNKMVFYSTSGEKLFQKYFPFHGYPHHVYSDDLYFYVLFKRQSILICYNIYGEIRWQWRLPFPVHPHIAIFQGTIYVPDIELNRLLLYKYGGWSSGCCLRVKNPYIRNLNIRLKGKKKDKVVIAEICHLPDGHLVVSDINNDCLLYISNEGDIVSRLSLPSTATDICRWDSNQIGVTLPLEKQLRIIGNLSKTVRCVSLSQSYVRACKLFKNHIACYCDKPSYLDILAIGMYNQVKIIRRICIPVVVKSLSIVNETVNLLIVTKAKAFLYNTSICSDGHGSNSSSCDSVESSSGSERVINVKLSRLLAFYNRKCADENIPTTGGDMTLSIPVSQIEAFWKKTIGHGIGQEYPSVYMSQTLVQLKHLIGGGCLDISSNCDDDCSSSSSSSSRIKMVPSDLLSQEKPLSNLYGGSIDKMFVYLIDNNRMFAINDHNLVVKDLVNNNLLNTYIDLVDVFSRNICVSEMFSSTLHLQNLTISDKARHFNVSSGFEDMGPITLDGLFITEHDLIVGYDKNSKKIRIFTFDGQLLDSIKLNVDDEIKMCQWQSDTLVLLPWDRCFDLYDDEEDYDDDDDESQLLTLKVEYPLSLATYQTRYQYQCIASLSNNQLVCSCARKDKYCLYVIDIDEIHSAVNEIRQIDIPETLLTYIEGIYISVINNISITHDDVIIISNRRFIIFFNSDGQYLYSVRHYMGYDNTHQHLITSDDCYLYICGWWEKYYGISEYEKIICLTQRGEYKRIFLNKRIYKHEFNFNIINCKGPKFIGSCRGWFEDELYAEGMFMNNRESHSISRLLTDKCPVQVKDIDISDEGKTVICEKANSGNVKVFNENGDLQCYRDVGSLVGGVCFTEEKDIIVTLPKTQEISQLKQQDLEKYKTWQSRVPYGVIQRKVWDIYWCVHINLIECHCMKIDGDQLKVLESVSLLKLDSGLHFPSITFQMNKEIFSNELINKPKYNMGNGEGRNKSGEIIGKGRLTVRCGNFIAESMSGIDKISVRKLPHRRAMIPLSIPVFDEPVNFDIMDITDCNSKLIKLDDNVSVFMFRNTVTLINTATGDILQHKQLPQQQPLGICRWTDEDFIVNFGKEMMIFNRDLCCLKSIKTEKYYNTIYKYIENQLVCGGHYIIDITQDERDMYNDLLFHNNKHYYLFNNNSVLYIPYYVDVVDINDGKYKYEVCRGETGIVGKLEGDVEVIDVAVTSFGDVVIVRREMKDKAKWWTQNGNFIEWYREESLVRRIEIKQRDIVSECEIFRPCLTVVGENVYITDKENNIYQIPEQTEHQTSEDIDKYLFLRCDENEVFRVLGFDISKDAFMVFGIIPGRQPFAFFHYDK